MEMDSYKFKFPLQMRWNDLDALGHVNNAIFVTYFEVARGTFMMKAVPGWDWTKNMFLIANIEANFQKELLLTAINPEVRMRTAQIGTKSFVLEYAIVSQKDDATIVHATGSTTQVMFDMKTRKTIEIEDSMKEALLAFDK